MKDDTFIKNTFEELSPSQEEKEKIWTQIEDEIFYKQKENTEDNSKKKPRKIFGRFAGTAAAVFAVFFMLGVCAYAATGVKISDIFLNLAVKEAEEDIIKNTLNLTQRMETYAPELYACNEDYFVFAHLRGMVIYDRKKDCVASLVDLQEIDCNNFDTVSRFTRIVEEDGKLFIFNEQNGKADRIYYECDLTDLENPQLIEKKTGEMVKLCSKWEKYKKAHYTDTFDSVPRSLTDFLNNNMYSENSFIWTAKDGSHKQSALMVRHEKENLSNVYYALFTLDKDTKKHDTVKLNIEVTVDTPEEDYLPRFVYKGDDAHMAAICEYMYKEYSKYEYQEKETVFMPAPLIYKRVEKNNRIIIFANLYSTVLTKNGNVLQDIGGGNNEAKLYLKKTDSGYSVVKAKKAGDGAKWLKDINRFTKDYPDVKEQILDGVGRYLKCRVMLRKMVNMYLKETELGIVYYKDYGGDKEKIADYIEELPAFSYSGSDVVKKAVCDYMCKEQAEWYKKNGGIYLPKPDIYDTKEEDDRLYVFGNFEYEIGYQYGGLLCLSTSNERLGRMCLKPKGNGYVVENFIYIDKNEMDWWQKLEDLTIVYPSAMKKFQDYYNGDSLHIPNIKKEKKREKKLIKMYTANSGLNITSYKGIGDIQISID